MISSLSPTSMSRCCRSWCVEASALLTILVGCAHTPDITRAAIITSFDAYMTADSVRDIADTLLAHGNGARAAVLYLRAGRMAPALGGDGEPFIQAAEAYASSHAKDAAYGALESALANGFHDATELASDSLLGTLRSDGRWREVLRKVGANNRAYRRAHSDPDAVLISTADIPRFWHAYDLAARESTSVAKAAVFRREYLERGARGLCDFYRLKIRTPAKLVETIDRFPRFYAAVRAPTMQLTELEPTVRGIFHRMRELYPEAIYPDIYFVVGRLTSAGTSTDAGLLFGAEQNVGSPEVPLDELPAGIQRIVQPRAELPHTIAHELVHFEQDLGNKHSLLDIALVEGGASFLADLMVPNQPPPFFLTWGSAHEREVWNRFAREMHTDKVDDWIGNNGAVHPAGNEYPSWPADLGYFVGYEISKSYYEHARDKRQAIRDLILLSNSEAILRDSHYADRFAQ